MKPLLLILHFLLCSMTYPRVDMYIPNLPLPHIFISFVVFAIHRCPWSWLAFLQLQ